MEATNIYILKIKHPKSKGDYKLGVLFTEADRIDAEILFFNNEGKRKYKVWCWKKAKATEYHHLLEKLKSRYNFLETTRGLHITLDKKEYQVFLGKLERSGYELPEENLEGGEEEDHEKGGNTIYSIIATLRLAMIIGFSVIFIFTWLILWLKRMWNVCEEISIRVGEPVGSIES